MHITTEIEEVEPAFKPMKVTVTVLLTSKEELQGLANEDGKAVHAIVYSVTDRAKDVMLKRIRDVAQPPVVLAEEKDALGVKTMGSQMIGPT